MNRNRWLLLHKKSPFKKVLVKSVCALWRLFVYLFTLKCARKWHYFTLCVFIDKRKTCKTTISCENCEFQRDKYIYFWNWIAETFSNRYALLPKQTQENNLLRVIRMGNVRQPMKTVIQHLITEPNKSRNWSGWFVSKFAMTERRLNI